MPKVAEDQKINSVLSILSKGESGTGKSIASCGKEFRPVYVFDFEDRMRSVINYYRKLDGHCKDIEYDTYAMGRTSFSEIDRRMDQLVGGSKYKTVVIATLSSYVDIILVHLINSKSGVKRGSGADAGKMIGGIPVNELEDYNAEDAAIIYELISFLKQLQLQGVNVILEAHVTTVEEKNPVDKSMRTTRPIVTKGRKAPARIPGYFDEVWHFYNDFEGLQASAQKVKYMFTTQPTQLDYAKTSNGITGFDWTGKDLSVEVMKQLSKEVKENPRIDPNTPKVVRF